MPRWGVCWNDQHGYSWMGDPDSLPESIPCNCLAVVFTRSRCEVCGSEIWTQAPNMIARERRTDAR